MRKGATCRKQERGTKGGRMRQGARKHKRRREDAGEGEEERGSE